MEDIDNFSIIDNYEIPSNILNTFVSLKCEPKKQDLIAALSNNNISGITTQNTLQGFEDIKISSDSTSKEGLAAKLLENAKKKPIESNISVTRTEDLKDLNTNMQNTIIAMKNMDLSWYENFNLEMFKDLGKKLADKYGKYFDKNKAGDAWLQVGKELLNELKDAWKNNADSLTDRLNNIETFKTLPKRKETYKIAHERSKLAIPTEILTSIMASPDFMSNMYLIYLTRLEESEEPGLMSNLGKNPNITFVADGIDIPQVKYEAFETKFLNTSIKREKPEPIINRKGTLTIRNDENFYLLSELESGSGYSQPHKWQESQYAFYRDGKYNMKVVQLLPSEMIYLDYLGYEKVAIPNRGPMSFKGKTIPPTDLSNLGINTEKNTTHDISTLMFTETMAPRYKRVNEIRAKVYIFEEVQFLGRNNALEYKRNDASPLSSTFNFIFKQLSVSIETDPFISKD